MSQVTENKFISIKQIINRLLHDEPYIEQLNLGDAIEWAGECLNSLGVKNLYKSFSCTVDITDYRGTLPSNFKSLEAIREADSTIALKETTSKLQFPQTTTSRQKLPLDYEIKENVIFVGFETGSIEMEVLGYRLDEDGFPLIPDEERTIKCIYWYIAQKVAYPKWAMGKLPDKVFSYVDQQHLFYLGSARYKGKTPNKRKMQSIVEQQMQIVPNQHLYYHNFVNRTNIDNIYIGR